MPNWVYNTINNYPKELYEEYKSDNGESAIDFQKIIPEPEEIINTASGSTEDIAKKIYAFRVYQGDRTELSSPLRYDPKNPLRETIQNIAKTTAEDIGYLAIKNPDKSLNNIFGSEDPNDDENTRTTKKFLKRRYDRYVSIFGNERYSDCDIDQAHENFIAVTNKDFEDSKNDDRYYSDIHKKYENIEAYGKHLAELKEKYGYDNWYDWQCAHWGTKWNACHSDYDKDNETLRFNTAWSIPYPIIAKIAQDHPEVKLDGYSDEECNQWFDEYTTENGEVHINATGEIIYEFDKDGNITEPIENREVIDPPEVITYKEIVISSKEEFEKMQKAAENLKASIV